MDETVAIAEMEHLLSLAIGEDRGFSGAEQTRFDQLRGFCEASNTLAALRQARSQPTNPTRPVAGAVRSLSAACTADGLFARMVQAGRARLDIPIDIRALGSDQALGPAPGIAVQPNNLGLINAYYPIVNRLLPALGSIPVTSNAVTYTRISYAPDSASPSTGATGNKASRVTELDAKPESVLATEPVTEEIATWAHWIPCSKQVLDDVSGLLALLDVLLVAGLLDKTDAGVFADMTFSGRYTPFSPTGGDTTGDSIARAAAALQSAGATAVKVAVNPATLLNMFLAKTSGSGDYIGTPANMPTLVSTPSVPVGKLLAWSDTGAVWGAREGVSVVAGLNADDFTHNRVTLLAEHRGSVLTLDARHVLYGNV